MEVNGVLVDVRMMLDETGSAFFSKLKVQVDPSRHVKIPTYVG